jgi:dienelactone hydrolase
MRFLTVAVILLCAITSRAEEFVPVWPEGKMPIGLKKSQNVGEETVWANGIIKGVSVPGFEVFLPTNAAKRTMGIIICPGGAYGCLDYEKEGRRTARFLQKCGVAAFVMKYRLRQYKWNAALSDVQRSLSLIRANAKKWNVSPDHIGVMGYSAGGHLAMRSVAVDGKRVYEPIDEIDNQSAKPSFAAFVYGAYFTENGNINPTVKAAFNTDIRMVMLTGLADLYRFSTVGFFDGCTKMEKCPKVEAHFYPEGCHGFGVSTKPHNDVYRWERLLLTWLRRIAGDVSPTEAEECEYLSMIPEGQDE